MDLFLIELASTCDIKMLNTLKEKIKNQVTDSNLTWLERANLYKKVQLINKRIELLMYDQVS